MVFFLAPFSRFLARKMDLLAQKDKKSINESCFYQTFSVVGDRIYIFNKEWFDNPILHKFEHYNFYIPSGFDKPSSFTIDASGGTTPVSK